MPSREMIEVAAVHRLCDRFGLNEGIDNHVSVKLPDGTFLLTPDGIAWSMVRASDILHLADDGTLLAGRRVDEITFALHRAMQRRLPVGTCLIHTHMPDATAIACAEGGRLEPMSQNALRFFGRIAYEDDYGGLGFEEEAARLAARVSEAPVLFLASHGVFVRAPSVAHAFDDLYYLERAAEVQVHVASLGLKPRRVPDAVAAATAADFAGPANRAEGFFGACLAELDRDGSDHAR